MGNKAPDFEAEAVFDQEFIKVSSFCYFFFFFILTSFFTKCVKNIPPEISLGL